MAFRINKDLLDREVKKIKQVIKELNKDFNIILFGGGKKEELILKVEEAYKVKDQISKEVDEANKVEVIEEDFKEVLLDVENEKTNLDIEDNFSKEEKNLKEIEDQSIDKTKEFLEVEGITETEQPFNDLENLIFGDAETEKREKTLPKYTYK